MPRRSSASHRPTTGTLRWPIKAALAEKGIHASIGGALAVLRPPPHHAQKNSAHATEQSRPDIPKRRQDWFDDQPDIDPARLLFIDETWASTNMARRHRRCPRGERLRVGVSHGHGKTTTFVGALTLRGFIAPMVLDGPINRIAFETYVARVLVPELRPGDVVVMDNLSSHKGPRACDPPSALSSTSSAPTSAKTTLLLLGMMKHDRKTL